MRLITSTQIDVRFLALKAPVVIDKSKDWGPGNLQEAPDGAFLKLSSDTEISHLVQPNADFSAPEGWVPGSGPGLFSKAAIWVEEDVLPPGVEKKVDTSDGTIVYKFEEPAVVCYNDKDGAPNTGDSWVQKLKDVKKNYHYDIRS